MKNLLCIIVLIIGTNSYASLDRMELVELFTAPFLLPFTPLAIPIALAEGYQEKKKNELRVTVLAASEDALHYVLNDGNHRLTDKLNTAIDALNDHFYFNEHRNEFAHDLTTVKIILSQTIDSLFPFRDKNEESYFANSACHDAVVAGREDAINYLTAKGEMPERLKEAIIAINAYYSTYNNRQVPTKYFDFDEKGALKVILVYKVYLYYSKIGRSVGDKDPYYVERKANFLKRKEIRAKTQSALDEIRKRSKEASRLRGEQESARLRGDHEAARFLSDQESGLLSSFQNRVILTSTEHNRHIRDFSEEVDAVYRQEEIELGRLK